MPARTHKTPSSVPVMAECRFMLNGLRARRRQVNRQFGNGEAGPYQSFDVTDIRSLVRPGKRNRMPAPAGAASAADAVNIVLRVLG